MSHFQNGHRRHIYICLLFKFSPTLDKYFEEDKIKENLHSRDSRFMYVYNNELSENEIRLWCKKKTKSYECMKNYFTK